MSEQKIYSVHAELRRNISVDITDLVEKTLLKELRKEVENEIRRQATKKIIDSNNRKIEDYLKTIKNDIPE
jgi:ribosomal protein S13